MAIAKIRTSTLQLVLQDGTDRVSGDPIYKMKSFNNVKANATAEQLYAIAIAFEGLQQRSLYEINRKDSLDIRLG